VLGVCFGGGGGAVLSFLVGGGFFFLVLLEGGGGLGGVFWRAVFLGFFVGVWLLWVGGGGFCCGGSGCLVVGGGGGFCGVFLGGVVCFLVFVGGGGGGGWLVGACVVFGCWGWLCFLGVGELSFFRYSGFTAQTFLETCHGSTRPVLCFWG